MAIKTFQPYVDPAVDPHVRTLLNLVFNKLNNHASAISEVNKTKAGVSTTTIINEGGGSSGGGGSSATIGTVDNQTGQVAYTTGPADNGGMLILSDASPIAVTLGTGVTTPWIVFIANQGAGTATLTPQTGTISYAANSGAASMPLLGGYCTIIAYDGANWWAWTEPIVPVTIGASTHLWLNSYNAVTGLFTAAQPAFTDISGTASAGQIPALSALSGSITAGQLPASVPVVSFGTGAPVGSSTEGYIYFDTTGSPYHGYVYHSSAWNIFS